MAGPNLHLDSNIGCLFIGTLFSLIFFGCTLAQTVFYYRTYRKDRLFLKALYVWVVAVQNHANPSAIGTLPKFWISEFFFASVTFFIVQLFFIHKIWTLSAEVQYRRLLSLTVTFLSCLSFAGGIGISAVAAINQSFTFILPHERASGHHFVPGTIQQLGAVLTDIYITVSLCVVLRSSQASFKRTQTLLGTLSLYAINRGMLAAAVQLMHYVSYSATYHNSSLIWMVFHIPGSKVYVNCLLAMLNIRHKLRGTRSSHALDATSIRFVDPEELGDELEDD
ncbi:hypothetical protein CERSUDRAFT_98976 [Gelatoporia subvermispora B]|uniref:DUF6534 domain-containing protein n=1 Tax=Ceriporiopsis subvermispora (strain B) TaxID=914234 RepID=M2QLG7_CERS8|nr:hypothetical protein CERSUDRAFT_98976 [Gelatoporia subvermispora B]